MWKIMKDNLEDLLSPNLWRSLACETVGTAVIVLVGCGSWMPAGPGQDSGHPNVVHISLAFGLSVATMLWVFAHISGGHFNPALTLATLATRRVSIVRGFLYIVAQVLGGILGAGVLYGLTPVGQQTSWGLGANVIPSSVQDGKLVSLSSAQAFGVELLVTLVFVLAYFASRDAQRSDLAGSYPLTVGLAVVVCHLFAINFTGAGMNPARSFGPAVIMDVWTDHWVYWVGPLTGGLLAGLLYDYVFSAGATVAKASKCLLRTKRPASPAAPEKVPLDDTRAAPAVIEIDEKEAEVTSSAAASASASADAAAVEKKDKEESPSPVQTDSDKAKLTENAGGKE